MSRRFLAEVQKEQQTLALNFREGRRHPQQASSSSLEEFCECQATVEDREDGNWNTDSRHLPNAISKYGRLFTVRPLLPQPRSLTMTAVSDLLVTDDLTILLALIAATTFLLNNLYRPQPLVHPILLGRQSDVGRARNPGESALYRNYGTGLMGRVRLCPIYVNRLWPLICCSFPIDPVKRSLLLQISSSQTRKLRALFGPQRLDSIFFLALLLFLTCTTGNQFRSPRAYRCSRLRAYPSRQSEAGRVQSASIAQ